MKCTECSSQGFTSKNLNFWPFLMWRKKCASVGHEWPHLNKRLLLWFISHLSFHVVHSFARCFCLIPLSTVCDMISVQYFLTCVFVMLVSRKFNKSFIIFFLSFSAHVKWKFHIRIYKHERWPSYCSLHGANLLTDLSHLIN